MTFLAFLYPFPYAAKATPTTNPALLSTLWASLLTPPQEGKGGSEEGASPSGHPSSSKDKRLLTPQWPCTPGTPKRHLSTRARHPASLSWRCHPLWSVGILSVIPGPVKCGSWDQCQELASHWLGTIWSWEEEYGARQAPVSPTTVHSGADCASVVENTALQGSFSFWPARAAAP